MRERSEMVLADLIQIRAEQQPELPVLTFEHLSLDDGTADEVRSYADLQTHANRIAAALLARGVEPGDRIAIMMRNHPEFVEAMVAASILGAIFVPIDPRTRGEKLVYMLRNSGCVGLLCADYCLDELAAVQSQTPDVRFALVVETGEDTPEPKVLAGAEPLAELLTRPTETVDVRADGPLAPLQIMYTSGTTGDPKGIVGVNLRFCAAGVLAEIFGYQPDERPYTGLSFTHGNAQSVTLAPALTRGLRAVISRRFTRSRLWDVTRRYGCTSFSLVGGMATAIYSQPARADDADNGPVGSFGKPMSGIEMKILDDDDRECEPGVIGEICVRPGGGGDAEVEYFGNPEASRKKIRRGWNRSGDMGHRDAEGWLFFDYRAGGGIRHNGDVINASYVEKTIAEHPAVSDVFVYGVPAASGAPGEKDVVAAVVFAAGAPHDTAAIFDSCRERLEPNFVPSYLQVVAEIPKTASEKPQERFLQAQFAPDAANVHVP
jgi:crotonobetaine/carnitine-CoA ligase